MAEKLSPILCKAYWVALARKQPMKLVTGIDEELPSFLGRSGLICSQSMQCGQCTEQGLRMQVEQGVGGLSLVDVFVFKEPGILRKIAAT